MKRIWPYILIIAGGFAIYLLLSVRVIVQNKQPGYRFGVSRLLTNIFLVKQGYWNKVREIRVIYTPEKQDRMNLIDGQDMALVSNVGIDQKGKSLTISQYYNPDKIGQIIINKNWLNRDLMINICVDLAGKGVGLDGCQKKADDYLKWAKRYGIDKLVTIGKKLTFGLVKSVYAGCSGTIKCGVWIQTCTCSQSGSSCPINSDGDDCGTWGTCSCDQLICDENRYSSLSCSSVDDGFCPSVNERSCANGGECPNDQSCTLVSGGGCTPQCAGKECGDDGCGGSCGTCDSGFTCNNNDKCIADCNCTSPTAPSLSSPASATNYSNYNGSLTLSWNAPSDWGDECSQGYGRRYNVCWGTNAADPCSGGSIQSVTVPTATVNLNTLGTFYWKVVAYNDCNETASSNIWSVVNNSLAKTCALSTGAGLSLVNGIYIGVTNTPFDINLSGNANSTTSDRVRLVMETTGYSQIVNYQTLITPLMSEWTNGVTYVYQFTGSSLATTNNNVSGTTNINIGRAGNYYMHCDLPTDPSKCSGDPICIYNGGSSNGCVGSWPSCSGPANARGGDNLELCITNENCTNLCGQSRGCGLADCAATGLGTPDQLTLINPDGTVSSPDSYPTATDSINLQWNTDTLGLADTYSVAIYQSGVGASKFSTAVDKTQSTYILDVSNPVVWDKSQVYYWRVKGINIDCGSEVGPWSTDGYFKFNSSPVIITVTPLPTPYPTAPPLPTPSLPPEVPPTQVPTPEPPYEPPLIPTLPPTSTPPPEVIDINDSPVLPDMYGRNHTCEVDAGGNRIFRNLTDPGTYVGGQVKFLVEVSDADGADDIASVQLRFNNQTHSMQLQSPVPLGTQISATLTLDFDSGDLTTSALPIELKADDKSGATTNWIQTQRYLKVWDCNVPLSGTMYDSSSVGNAVCSTGIGFQIPAGPEMNFNVVEVDQNIPAGGLISVNVITPPGSAYTAPKDTVIWGRTYSVSPNSDVQASNVSRRWIDMGNGYTPINCGVQYQVNDRVVDPYAFNPSLNIDFSGIINQEPWYQVAGGGVMSRSSVIGMVPITCKNDMSCKYSITIDSAALGSDNNGLVAAPSVDNNSGCVLGVCLAGIPNDWWYEGNVINDNYSYQYFYDNYYVKQGLGAIFTGPKTMSQILAALPPGNQQIVFVNGNLTIDTNNQVGSGDFLMVIVSGNITISQNVNLIEGIFVSGGIITAEANTTTDNPLVINGMLYTSSGSNNHIKFIRGFSDKSKNDINPSVVVNYQPRFLFSMPVSISKVITDWRIVK